MTAAMHLGQLMAFQLPSTPSPQHLLMCWHLSKPPRHEAGAPLHFKLLPQPSGLHSRRRAAPAEHHDTNNDGPQRHPAGRIPPELVALCCLLAA